MAKSPNAVRHSGRAAVITTALAFSQFPPGPILEHIDDFDGVRTLLANDATWNAMRDRGPLPFRVHYLLHMQWDHPLRDKMWDMLDLADERGIIIPNTRTSVDIMVAMSSDARIHCGTRQVGLFG